METAQQPTRTAAQTQLAETHRLLFTQVQPADRAIYKLRQRPPFTGTALKMNLRLFPQFKELESRTVVQCDSKSGGLFFEVCPQKQQLNAKGNPEVDHESALRVVAKLTIADVSGLLAAYEAYRQRNLDVPKYLQHYKNPEPNVVSLFHDSGNGTNLTITWLFREEDSVLRLSKSKDHSQQLTLTTGEELVVVEYLRHAMRAFIAVGF